MRGSNRGDGTDAGRAADDGVVEVFNSEVGVNGRVRQADGRWSVWADGVHDRDGALRVSELLVDRRLVDPAAVGRLLDRLEADQPLRPAFRPADQSRSDDVRLDLLSSSPDSDAVWAATGRDGPGDHLARAHRAELDALARFAEARIAATTGEHAPDLSERVEFLTPAEFEREIPDSEHVLGAYSPDSGRLLIKDTGDLRSHGVLIHEGLHALRAERAAEVIPRDLDEAITEHFTRVIDPAASAATVERRDADGKIVYGLPLLPEPLELDGARLVRVATPYEDRLPLVDHVEQITGRAGLWEYYRSGDPSRIRSIYDGRLGNGAWARLVDRVEQADWETPRARPVG